jgi:DNA-binding transcriptional ArsR family regulator/precorrin-6B methylase 2
VLAPRADLFRLLGDEDRLRLLALCAEEELTVGELAALLGESQPQVTKKSQPLRDAGLLATRRDGTRTLLKSHVETEREVILGAALEEGRRLCSKDGSLAKVARVVAQREELSKKLFDAAPAEVAPIAADAQLIAWAPLLAPLLPGHALAIDVGTGEGTLLPLLSPLFDKVVAIDRSAARLAQCAARIDAWGLPNIRLREGTIDDITQELTGKADLVVMARVLVHASRPQDVIAQATRLLRPGGHLAIIDYLPHDDESLREQGHVWLGFESQKLRTWLEAARLGAIHVHAFPSQPTLQLAVGKKESSHGHS